MEPEDNDKEHVHETIEDVDHDHVDDVPDTDVDKICHVPIQLNAFER